jgi:hypothetical protein
MPTILRQDGFDFFFYANEHRPRHVHVKKGDDFGRIDLESMRLVSSTFKVAEERKVMEIARLNRGSLLEAWDGYFRHR